MNYQRISITAWPRFFLVCMLFGANLFFAQSHARTLTLEDAERMALDSDPLIAKATAQQEALQERSVAAGTWPDPKLRLGVRNISMESWMLDDEPMTAAVVGINQRFPPWGAVGAKSAQLAQMASATGEELDNRKLQTLLSVRTAWLNVVYQAQAERLVEESVSTFDQLKEITRLQYRAGRGNQQDVIRAQLEKSLLEDRQKSTHTMWETALAALKKWLGEQESVQDVDSEFPILPEPPPEQQLRRALERHPWLAAGKTRVKAAEKGVDYAQAQSRPGWALDLQYGYRAAERDDLATAMLMVDLPFFTGNRQDREIKASQADLAASQSLLDDRRRVLYQKLDDSLARYRQAGERLSLYENQVLPESEQNTEATLSAYQSGVTDFNTLVRARLTELQSQLQHLKLRVEQAKAQVELLYLAGG